MGDASEVSIVSLMSSPFKHSVEGKSNTTNFQNVGGHKVCFSCGNVASSQWCGACKMTEYCRESESLTVYHIGAHKHPLKQDTKVHRKQVRDAVLRNRGLGAGAIQQAEVGQAVANGDIWGGAEKSHATLLC